jgi:DNA polymerase phi
VVAFESTLGNKMRKRKNPVEDEDDSSEMEVDGEEKLDQTEESDAEMSDDEESPEAPPQRNENPFLDSFYGLSSENLRERSQAAQTMLHQCLLGPSANTKDSSYALRRLLNGLCSGRAAARQGNASALASFLKISFHLEKMESIQIEMEGESSPGSTPLSFVRERLLKATDPNQISGKKKGSEERDYQFGRLFGILGIVRSNILLPDDDSDISEIIEVTTAFVSDLIELFWLKKWMREPAAHGITTLLNLFYEGRSKEPCKSILDNIISKVIVPKILKTGKDGKEGESNHKSLLESYCAEQVGLACFIQSQFSSSEYPYPLSKPVLSVETIPLVSKALAETSCVVQPRTHFVWDTIWCYLFDFSNSSKNKGFPAARNLRAKCAVGDDSAIDLVDAIIQSVVTQQLLGMETEKGGSASKATHERRSLALCIIKNLTGVPFVLSLHGPTQLILDQDAMENVLLTPIIVRRLFLDVICAGKQNSKQSSHLLKPLALEVLSSIAANVADSDAPSESKVGRKLACVRALLKAEVRFDARTKTPTIADLLGLTNVVLEESKDELFSFWNQYLSFLETEFLDKCAKGEHSSSNATGYVELMYSAAKRIIRIEAESETHSPALKEYKEATVHRILGFFISSAFFDCSNMEKSTEKMNGKKKKVTDRPLILICAEKLSETSIPYAVRSVISARFFALVSDFIHNEIHQKGEANKEKDSIALSFLSKICQNWNILESSGAKRFAGASGSEEDDDDSSEADVGKVLEGLQNYIANLIVSLDKEPNSALLESKKRCCTGIAVLAYTLYIHRLSIGKNDDEIYNDNPDADEEDDEEEICNALEGLKDVTDDFNSSEEDTNPLLGLSELCANILSSPLGSGDIGRGASPKLVREAVKFAWLGGLRLSSVLATEDRTFLDNDVIGILLNAIGASTTDEDGNVDDEEDGSDEEEDSDGEDNESDDENVFGQASTLLEDDPEDMETDKAKEEVDDREEDESDVELDHDMLQSMLQEDSDADLDEDVLEHHEGADAALAKLIKLKQDARKAGQLAREKIEISNQLRCSFLIELLFGRSDAWNRLFRSDIILKLVVPMLNHRKNVEKSLNKTNGNRSKSGYGEKRALLDRLTSLLKFKICKLKLSSMPIKSSVDSEFALNLVEDILNEARRTNDKNHASCCSSSIIFVLRTVQSVPDTISVGSALSAAVEEWSTKRTTRLGTAIFDDLIEHMPR